MNATANDIKLASLDTTYDLTENGTYQISVSQVNITNIDQQVTISIGKSVYFKKNRQYDNYGNINPLYYYENDDFPSIWGHSGGGNYTYQHVKPHLTFMLDYIFDMYENVEVSGISVKFVDFSYDRFVGVGSSRYEPLFFPRRSSRCISFIVDDPPGFMPTQKRAFEGLMRSDIKQIDIHMVVKMPEDVKKFIEDFTKKDSLMQKIKDDSVSIWKSIKNWFNRFM